ncbi:MAG: hypothetical protein EOO77_20345 [Oxalobacteraceae bacterium]|nr:MAG: hypothetical protein EOO77_20345 [Oxalobacteraceae bacterium]
MRYSELTESPSTGVYVCAKYDKDTRERLADLVREHKIDNPIPSTEYHTTIVYSKSPVYWKAEHDVGKTARATRWEVWPSHKSGKQVLVLHLESNYLTTRFDLAMSRGASYDFPDYKPHISFSYDIPEDFDASKLPVPDFDLIIDKEIAEPLKD